MDALKSAGRALIRSPSLAKQSWAGGRHRSEFVRPGSGLRRARGQGGQGGFVPPRAAGAPGVMSGCVWGGSAGSGRNSGSPGVARRGRLEPLYPLQHNPRGPLWTPSPAGHCPEGRSQPECHPRSPFLPSGRVQVVRLESRLFSNLVFLRAFPWGLVQVPGYLGKRQTQTRCRFSRESGRAERSLPQPPLGLLSESRHLAHSPEA